MEKRYLQKELKGIKDVGDIDGLLNKGLSVLVAYLRGSPELIEDFIKNHVPQNYHEAFENAKLKQQERQEMANLNRTLAQERRDREEGQKKIQKKI